MKKTVSLIVGAILLSGVLDLKATTIGVDEGTPCSYNLKRKHADRIAAASQRAFEKKTKVDAKDNKLNRLENLEDLQSWVQLAFTRIEAIKSTHAFLVRKESRRTCSHQQSDPHCKETTEFEPAGNAVAMWGKASDLASRYEALFRSLRQVVYALALYESRYPEALETSDQHSVVPAVRSRDLRQAFANLLQGYNNTNFNGVLKDTSLTADDLLEFVNGPVVAVSFTEPNILKYTTRDNPRFGKYNVREQLLENPALKAVQRALGAIDKLE